MMTLKIDRGHIQVKIGEKTVTIQGEMFFPADEKMGFALFMDTAKRWDAPFESVELTKFDLDAIVRYVRAEFDKGGHVLEIEGYTEGDVTTLTKNARVEGGLPCTKDGWWWSPAAGIEGRRQFKQGEIMPIVESDYGDTIWQWDEQQD